MPRETQKGVYIKLYDMVEHMIIIIIIETKTLYIHI